MSVPAGLILPTVRSMESGNPRDSAIAVMKQTNATQNNVNKIGGKRRRRKTYKKRNKKYGGASITPIQQVAVPQFQMQYKPQGGVGTNPNDQIKLTSAVGMQSTAWSVNDNFAAKKGGSRRHKIKKNKKNKKTKRY